MQTLNGSVQRYPWGTTDAIFKLLGQASDGEPLAEYWLGAHVCAPASTPEGNLDVLIEQHPQWLGTASRETFGSQLPFLLKILSAAQPLSLQVHPDREQARSGFARENAAGIPIDAPERIYCDDWPKPEILIALDTFETLCGFRDPKKTAALISGLGIADELSSIIRPLVERKGDAGLAQVFLDILSLEGERNHIVDVCAAAAMNHAKDEGSVGDLARTIIELDDVFGKDRGILAAILLNKVTLAPGEAVYVAPGQMHSHLRGTGIEVMASSDNVIRGGLTRKHIDAQELINVADFTSTKTKMLRPAQKRSGVSHYKTPNPEFDVWKVQVSPERGEIRLPGKRSARIILAISGDLRIASQGAELNLVKGQAAFLYADEVDANVSGSGVLFVTASGVR
ncbi:MAG: mannose-6-phosphate isomerase, class I [Propionibacteriaceae bacterium]|nr:mannose-6-phosphate isomerase, class I [Propionibacteriaceae bacterium]